MRHSAFIPERRRLYALHIAQILEKDPKIVFQGAFRNSKIYSMPKAKYQISNVGEKGFSLIELVVVLAIFLIIITVTINIFISQLNRYS